MITLSYRQKELLGLHYILDLLSPCSPYGRTAVKHIESMGSKERLETEFCYIRQLQQQLVPMGDSLDRLAHLMMQIRDITRTIEKCAVATLDEIELFEIKLFLIQLSRLVPLWQEMQNSAPLPPLVLHPLEAALELVDIEGKRVPSFYISDRYSPVLKQIRKEKQAIEEEIRKAATADRAALLQIRLEVVTREEGEERRIREELSENLAPFVPALLENTKTIGYLDLLLEKAKLAQKYAATQPIITEDRIYLQAAVSPQVSDALLAQGKHFTPITIDQSRGATVITGANMGGKSVAMKTICLNILLANLGFFVLAEVAHVPVLDHMLLIFEDLQSVDSGLSSFGGEIYGFNKMLEDASTGSSYMALDEFARGTNPEEGRMIVQAVTQYLNGQEGFSLLTTHYDGVSPLAAAHYQVIGLGHMDMEEIRHQLRQGSENGIALIAQHMNYGIAAVAKGQECPRDALNICRLLGLKPEILEILEKSY